MMYYIMMYVANGCNISQLPASDVGCDVFHGVIPKNTVLFYGSYEHTVLLDEASPYTSYEKAANVISVLVHDSSVVKLTVVDENYIHVDVIAMNTTKVDL